MYADAHVHLFDLSARLGADPELPAGDRVCASAHSRAEFLWQEDYARARLGQVILSFGIHPQDPSLAEVAFLRELARAGRIQAIGECGFDLYEPAFKATEAAQREAFRIQLELARETGLPLVAHCRRALHLFFAEAGELKRLPAVVFHGWPGSAAEARAFLSRGVNAYFSVGKALLRGSPRLADTARSIDASRLLSETDAPYMAGRGEGYTALAAIGDVVAAIARTRGTDAREMARILGDNFSSVFRSVP